MSKSSAVGTKLKITTGQTGSGTTVVVGGLTSINGIEITAETIDVTAMDNTSGYREKIPGFKEVGDVTASGFLDGDNEGQEKVYELLNSQAEADFAIEFPAKIGKTWSFKGYIAGFTTSAEIGDAVTFEATIIVTGQATLAATA